MKNNIQDATNSFLSDCDNSILNEHSMIEDEVSFINEDIKKTKVNDKEVYSTKQDELKDKYAHNESKVPNIDNTASWNDSKQSKNLKGAESVTLEKIEESPCEKLENKHVLTQNIVIPSRNKYPETPNKRNTNESQNESIRSNTIELQSLNAKNTNIIKLINNKRLKIKIIKSFLQNEENKQKRAYDKVTLKRPGIETSLIQHMLPLSTHNILNTEHLHSITPNEKKWPLPRIKRKAIKRLLEIKKKASRFIRMNYTPDFIRQKELKKEQFEDLKCIRCRKRFDSCNTPVSFIHKSSHVINH